MQDAFTRSKKFSDGRTFVSGQLNHNRVFTDAQEAHIVDYTIKIAKMFYGLPIKEFCKMALAYAEACESNAIPDIWVKEGAATRDWYYAFMSRHPTLTLKAPEGMSIARAMAFNRVNVEVFFNAYTDAITRHQFSPERIFNMDESGLSTVMKPLKVVCERGRPVASQVTQERGSHMTFVGIVNAAGHYIPPVFIIARKKMKPEFMRGAIDGSKGLANTNGWMTGEMFLETLKHIREKTFCSMDNKILLIIDNAECHMNIHAVEYAMTNGIVIVTLPPHTTAKLQPLDVSIFGPFKTVLRAIQNEFRISNPNRPITEYMLPEFASKAWISACSPANVLSGFAATGIWPLNSHIFPDDAFAGAEVTERESPQDTEEEEEAAASSSSSQSQEQEAEGPALEANETLPQDQDGLTETPGPSEPSVTPGPSSDPEPSTSTSLTPSSVRPFPKGPPRPRQKGRISVKACILTEDEGALQVLREKEQRKIAIEERKAAVEERRKAKGKGPQKRKGTQQPGKRGRPKKIRAEESDGSSEEDLDDPVLTDSSEHSDEFEEVELTPETYPFVQKELEVRDFLQIFTFNSLKLMSKLNVIYLAYLSI